MKSILISIVVAVVIIFGVHTLTSRDQSVTSSVPNIQNVSLVDGVQVIEIRAKGGFLPRRSVAKSGTPTILRFDTSGTFDCSSSVRIPSMNISQILPQTGVTDISIGTNQVGLLSGTCGMGMYPFEIEFTV